MRKILLLSTALLLSAGITACQSDTTETKASIPETTQETTVAETTVITTAAETESSTATPESQASADIQNTPDSGSPSVNTATGIVQDATMNVVTLLIEDGTPYSFSTMDAEKESGKDGITIGSTVTVTYDGDLKEDGSLTTATKVVVEDIKTNTLTGTVEDGSMNNLMVTADDGTVYSFSTMNAVKDVADGIIIGNTVTVTYIGDLKSDGYLTATMVTD